jgi:Xaa-Pro dipeptidase
MSQDIGAIQQYLAGEDLDGWLMYDFRGLNPIAVELAPFEGIVTRRWFLMIPREGRPVLLAHRIEESTITENWPEVRLYSSWRELEEQVGALLNGRKRVAMEYSPENAIPYVSRVDAGTIEMVRKTGVEIVSSANLVQHFQARWDAAGLASHRKAADFLIKLVQEMFTFVGAAVSEGRAINEYEVQEEILRRFDTGGMVWEEEPIVAIGPNSAKPHYAPTSEIHSPITEGQLLLLDIFCRAEGDRTISGDITWTAFVGAGPVPERIQEIFNIVAAARDAGVAYIHAQFAAGKPIYGWQVDDAVRGVIEKAGYGKYFTHRTGHSLHTRIHGNGVNIDNLETKDERILEPGVGFTIEPGIYLPDEFGIRSEINCHISEKGLEVTTLPLQTEVKPLL